MRGVAGLVWCLEYIDKLCVDVRKECGECILRMMMKMIDLPTLQRNMNRIKLE